MSHSYCIYNYNYIYTIFKVILIINTTDSYGLVRMLYLAFNKFMFKHEYIC